MKMTPKLLLLLALMTFSPLISQKKQDWKQRSQEREANFYEIQKEFSKKFKEENNNKRVEVQSKSRNVKVIGENDHIKYRRWEWYMSHNINPDGSFPTSSELQKSFDQFTQKEQVQPRNQKMSSPVIEWKNISRTFNSSLGYSGMGRTSSIGFHPTDPNIFWVCGERGGVWKTTDGGNNYIPQGDDLPYLGAGSIVVDYSNPNTLYVTTGDHTGGFGMGVYKSIDGGNTWAPTGFTSELSDQVRFYGMDQNPNTPSSLLLATNSGIYLTEDAGATWTRTYIGNAKDIQYSDTAVNRAFAVINNRVFLSTDGTNFSLIDSSPTHSGNGRVSLNGSQIVTWSNTGIWISNDNGVSWQQKNLAIDDSGSTVNFEYMTFNGNTLYGGRVDMFRSEDQGNTWTQISKWHGGTAFPEVHADHRFLASHNGRVYSCNDGGVDSYNESTGSWTQHNNGLIIPQYYSAASSETNGTIIGVGSQDNGGAARDANLTWFNTNGGDAGTQAIDPTDSNIRYSNYNPSPEIIRTLNGWQSSQNVKPADANTSWWVIPYVLDPNNSQRIVAGYHAVYTSDNRGNTWQKISPNFTDGTNYWEIIRSIAVAPSDSNAIYAARSRTFYYTFDNGATWGESTGFSQDISSITVDPNNSQIVYITFSQYSDGNKVFKSVDGGITWTNFSEGIPNIPTYSIISQKNTDELLYLGTQFGVFYRDSSMSSWQVYGEGLPKTIVRHLHINYNQQVLRAATYGRGIYETDLFGETEVSCTPVENLTFTTITHSSANISWSQVAESQQYRIQYKRNTDTDWMETSVTSTSITLDNLESDTVYDLQIIVDCIEGDDQYTTTSFTTTKAPDNLITNAIYEIKSALPAARSLTALTGFSNSSFNDNAMIYQDFNLSYGRWIVTQLSSGHYVLTSVADNTKVLDIENEGTASGTNVHIQQHVDGNIAQEWNIEKIEGSDYYKISSRNASWMCLDVSGAVDNNFSNVQIWMDNGTLAQRWLIEYVGPSTNDSATENKELPLGILSPEMPAPHTTKKEVLVNPNPAKEQFTINFKNVSEEHKSVTIELVNNLGVIVKTIRQNLLNHDGFLDVQTDQLPVGIYILLIKGDNGATVDTRRIVIQR